MVWGSPWNLQFAALAQRLLLLRHTLRSIFLRSLRKFLLTDAQNLGKLTNQLPSIIKGFGYSPNNAQLFSVIPYAVAAVITVVVAIFSDRLRIRGVMMLFTLPLAIIGYAVIANAHSVKVKYGMTFLMATGLYSAVPCVLGWISNNSAGHYKRATTTAAQLAIANSGGFVAGKKVPAI